ncbi:MAG: site-specific DNA-methyltransferase [Gammaproteobacteria bacterium]|nr:site-specific DNA-methyltransferase [Gammaproteobacteria bacterium]
MTNKTKLELTWIGKDKRPKLEPRILLEDPSKSYHAKQRVNENDIFDNKLIFGDNLLALKALEQEYAGKVKCVFIDPPYNTGSAFSHYDDGLEHSLWLSLMRDRLIIIHRLLSEEGSLWITIDDNEAHYLKVLCDEIFGRACFVTSFIWRKVDSPNDNKVPITPDHDYVLCFSRAPNGTAFKQKPDQSILDAYRPPDHESVRPYRDRLLKKNGKNSLRKDRPSMFFPIPAPDGTKVLPIHDDGREARWALGQKAVNGMLETATLVWKQRSTDGVTRWVPYTREYAPENPSRPYPTIWNDLDTTRQTKAHHKDMLGHSDGFDTPKPEDLIGRVLNICSEKGDLILDSFAGSGTTGAVAQKMGRKWIMVELGEHCHTHIIPRLQKVIDGEDPGGITKPTNWQGGGGFRYYTLAPSLLEKDKWDNWVVNKDYNPEMLSKAICKLEGFTYTPSDIEWWNHGYSTETDFIYVTTQNLSIEKLQHISDEVGGDKTLLVCCSAFRCNPSRFANLTIKKIPKMVLSRCEWAHDDYSLNIENLPQMEKEPEQQDLLGDIDD